MKEVERFVLDGMAFFVLRHEDSGEFLGAFFTFDEKECPDYWTAFGACLTRKQHVESPRAKSIQEAKEAIVRAYRDGWSRESPEQRHKWN